MKIAIVNYIRKLKGEGSFYRFLALEQAAKKENLPIEFFLFTDDNTNIISELVGKNILVSKVKMLNDTFSKYHFIYKSIATIMHDKRFDVLILRCAPLSPWFYFNFRKKKFSLITEHHTKEIREFFATNNYKSLFAEFFSQKICSKVIDGIIAVTEEIKDYEVKRLNKDEKRGTSIANGIFVENTAFTKYKSFDGHRLNLVFVGNRYNPWHGLDRIIRGILKYRGSELIKLHIVGDIKENDIKKYSNGNFSNLELHGIQTGKNLDNLFKEMNLAVGTLALHRKNQSAACALKVREYTARGIPFILAYNDVDLDKDLPFVKLFSPNEAPLDMQEVVKFAESVSSKHNTAELSRIMREYAEKRMDWRVKIKEYVRFAEYVQSIHS